jgi:hypothetical protein
MCIPRRHARGTAEATQESRGTFGASEARPPARVGWPILVVQFRTYCCCLSATSKQRGMQNTYVQIWYSSNIRMYRCSAIISIVQEWQVTPRTEGDAWKLDR